MEIISIKIESIKPYSKNAKLHSAKQIKQIATSIKEFGFAQPIVTDTNGVIIVGHGRYEAAKLLEMTEVPVIQVDLTEEQAKSYRLADNKLNESDWDMDLVIEELKSLSTEMLDLTGFSRDLILEDKPEDDAVPDLATKVKIKLGDMFQLGRHILLCGDATKSEDYKKVMGGGRKSPHGSKQNWDSYEVNGTIRRLTPTECERLQGFPDGWTKIGIEQLDHFINGGKGIRQNYEIVDMSDSQRYKTLGNAVTVNVVKEIVKRLI